MNFFNGSFFAGDFFNAVNGDFFNGQFFAGNFFNGSNSNFFFGAFFGGVFFGSAPISAILQLFIEIRSFTERRRF